MRQLAVSTFAFHVRFLDIHVPPPKKRFNLLFKKFNLLDYLIWNSKGKNKCALKITVSLTESGYHLTTLEPIGPLFCFCLSTSKFCALKQ